jgi:hypothetical protein
MEKHIEIKKPCPENWETMKIGLNSRFCDNCQKNVIDFTNEAVKKNIKERYGDKIPTEEIVISPASIFDSELLKTIKSN